MDSTPYLTTDPDVRRVVTVQAQKGGVGKTTTACNIASAAARLGFKVGVIDTDPNLSATETFFGIDNSQIATISDLMGEQQPAGAAAAYFMPAPDAWQPRHDLPWERGGALPGTDGGIEVIPGEVGYGAVVENVVAGMPRREYQLRRALKGVARQVDLILIDSQGEGGLKAWLNLEASGSVLAVSTAEPAPVAGLSNQMDLLAGYVDTADWEGRLIGVLPTRVQPHLNSAQAAIRTMRATLREREDSSFGEVASFTMPVTRRPFTVGATVWEADLVRQRDILSTTSERHEPLSAALNYPAKAARDAAVDVVAPHVRMALKIATITEAPSLPTVTKALRDHPIADLA